MSNSPEAEEPEAEMEAFDVRNLPVAIASFAEQGNTPVGGDDNDVSGSDGGSSDGLSSSTPNRSKRVPKFAVIFASLLAATASLGYLVKLISSNWVSHKGVVDLLYTVVFVDTWANVALTVLVLYFGVTKTVINFSLNAVAAFLRPNHVNSLWWLTLMLLRSRQSVSKIVRSTVWWSLGNQLWSLIPLGIDLMRSDSRTGGTFTAGTSNYLRALLTALFDANGDGVVTTTEVQMWFVGKTLRLLWFFVFLELARWAFSLKSAPSREETKDAQVWDKGDFLSQALRHHFAGLRGDKGVSWDQQARSALIDKSLAVAVYLTTAYSCVNALGVNMNGLLAVGGVSGLAVGFAAQKLVSNCISGALIFITQPFVEGDHVAFGQIDGRVEAVGWHSTRIASIEDGFSYIVPNTDVLSSALKNLSRREYVPVKLVVPFPPDTEANKFSVLSSEASKKFVNDITCLVNNTVSASSVRPPKVTVTFASGLKPSIKIKAFIDGNGNDKFAVEALEAEVTRQVVEHIENPCKVVVDAAFGLVER